MAYSKRYLDYLQSDLWKQRRQATLEGADFRCGVCGESERLEVHHLNYDRLGMEAPGDLVILCKSHHWMADKERQDPGFIERTLAQHNKQAEQPKPTYCHNVMRWYSKAKKIIESKEQDGYISKKRAKKLIELEEKFQSHILRCPICLGTTKER